MNRHDIIALPHASLRKPSKRVQVISDEIKQLIKDMESATIDWENHRQHEFGVALAAVQIDRHHRVVVVRNNFEDKKDQSFVTFINPEIVKKEGTPVEDYEGCLSVKDIYGMVPRYPKVRVKALNANGEEVRVKAEGFLARVFQHEIDHTKGKLFVDHIRDKDAFYRLGTDGKLEKLDYNTIKNSTDLWED